ncbi:hypothetical protein PINS_up004727 [Pythium insidiosum]|nr:hypothetical protein PINS_up004727 [Pythium insidiosum]
MLNATLIGKLLPKQEDEYNADVIQRGLAFNRKRLEINLTGYSPNGELISWRLRAANDTTYVKWEKAFRLAFRPIWVQNTPHCLICRQEFTLLFRAHHCRKCGTCMCDECSVFVPRLPMQGYYDVVRICRDCSPVTIQQSELRVGTKVLVYGIYPGTIVQVDATDDSEHGGAFLSVSMEQRGEGLERAVRRVSLTYVELFSEAVLSANRIKNAIRRPLGANSVSCATELQHMELAGDRARAEDCANGPHFEQIIQYHRTTLNGT